MSHKEFKIGGVSVYFPCKPYPSQFSMMDKIIRGIGRRQHCLLESPTGSGKSLALLCSSLAWQTAEKVKKELEDAEDADIGECQCKCHLKPEGQKTSPPTIKQQYDEKQHRSEVCNNKNFQCGFESVIDVQGIQGGNNDDDDFKETTVFSRGADKKTSRRHIQISFEEDGNDSIMPKVDLKQDAEKCPEVVCSLCSCDTNKEKQKIKVPKIYFGTRTHKQVSQIVRELGKTHYHDTKMTILGSREHTCIHGQVSKSKDKNNGCKELLDGPGCRFKDGSMRLQSQRIIKELGLASAWDLEDLVKLGKVKKACPYFLSRALREESDLIICPYNYLVDPLIRESMMINLKGHVVILDEAHNIEDAAREAASQSIGQDTIVKAIADIDGLMEKGISLADHSKLRQMLKSLDSFIEENRNKLDEKDFDKSYKIWNGFYIVAQLETLGLGPKNFEPLKAALAAVKAEADQQKELQQAAGMPVDKTQVMSPASGAVLEQVFQVLSYLYRTDMKYVDDYRTALVQSTSFVPLVPDGVYLNAKNKNRKRNMTQVEVFTLNFWCLNPGVAFSDFTDTRSVILTSGTLSPMNTFQSELGLDFKIQLEANHVIKDSQVWVGALGQGPTNRSLQAVFRNLETFAFQDELGALVLKVCQTVPHGVLCFLPSYKVLEKLSQRWETTGLWKKILCCKEIICEPRGRDKEDFEEQMNMFYDVVTNGPRRQDFADDDCGSSSQTGAIFFAVCRGKVSEGLDFADNFARAVISVGIPYPNFKDVQVELKRKYNDQHRSTRGLLSGSEWYEIQAFRALNQALGRCIRHRNDWGALIIVDERFVTNKQKYCRGLSKWVRSKVQTFPDFRCAMDSLSHFTSAMNEETSKQKNLDYSVMVSSPPLASPKKASYGTSTPITPGQTAFSPQVFQETHCKEQKMFSLFTPLTHKVKPASAPLTYVNKSSSRLTSKVSKAHAVASITPRNLVINSTPSGKLAQKMKSTLDDRISQCDEASVNTTSGLVSNKGDMLKSASSFKASSGSKTLMPQLLVPSNQNRDSSLECSTSSSLKLRIVTEIEKTGLRMRVFNVPPNLHSIFGGNLKLPVSTSERLVYLIDPPYENGAHPTAKLIKMTEEEKDHISEMKPGVFHQVKNDVPIAKVKPMTSALNGSSVQMRNGNSGVKPMGESHIPNINDISLRNNVATPDLNINVISDIPTCDSNTDCLSDMHALPCSTKEPAFGQSTVRPLASSKPLFRRSKTSKSPSSLKSGHSSESTDLIGSNLTETPLKTMHPATISVESPNDDVICQTPDDDVAESTDEEFIPEQLKRKVKTRKRKLSLNGKSSSKKIKDAISMKEKKVSQCSFKCSTCHHSLISEISDSCFIEQNTSPEFMRDDIVAKAKMGTFFFSANTSTSGLQTLKDTSLGLNTKYICDEDICVQFLYCAECLKVASDSQLPATVTGIKVQLAAGTGARYCKGQMWLFCDQVKVDKTITKMR